MASGTIYGTTANKTIDSKIEWSATSSVANNNSVVTASLWYRRNNTWSGTATGGTGTVSVTIDGQSGSAKVSLTVPNDKSWVKAIEVTKTVSHNSDGTRSITISASGSLPPSSLTSTTCSGTAVLDNIPRQATITSAPNFNDEGNPTINYSNPAGNSVTSLQACISLTGASADVLYRDISKTGTSYTFNLTDAERKVLRSATTGNSRTVQFVIRTIIGGTTNYSSVNKTYSIVNGNPTFTASQITYTDTSAVKDITENPLQIVQNQSNLSVTFTDATAKKEAKISKYDISVNGVTKTLTSSGTVDFGKINTSSNTEISITVTDSRGNTTTAKKTVTVLAWSLPIFTTSLERLNNYEDTTYLTVDASVSSVNSKNTMVISYLYKESGGNYITSEPIDIENKTKYTLLCDKNKAYIFSITVADAFDSVTTDFALSKGKFPLFIDTQKNAVGINDFPTEDEALRVAGGVAHFIDGVKISGNAIRDFIVEQGSSGMWIYEKWNSGICKLYANISYKPNATGYNYITYDYPFQLTGEPIFNINITRNKSVCKEVYPADSGGNYTDVFNKLDVSFYDATTTDYKIYASVQIIGTWK